MFDIYSHDDDECVITTVGEIKSVIQTALGMTEYEWGHLSFPEMQGVALKLHKEGEQ